MQGTPQHMRLVLVKSWRLMLLPLRHYCLDLLRSPRRDGAGSRCRGRDEDE